MSHLDSKHQPEVTDRQLEHTFLILKLVPLFLNVFLMKSKQSCNEAEFCNLSAQRQIKLAIKKQNKNKMMSPHCQRRAP